MGRRVGGRRCIIMAMVIMMVVVMVRRGEKGNKLMFRDR